jgi:hypothetical protein
MICNMGCGRFEGFAMSKDGGGGRERKKGRKEEK